LVSYLNQDSKLIIEIYNKLFNISNYKT
jgi:hypothetical protein